MKPLHVALLALILILGIVNVLASLGVIGGKSGGSAGGSGPYDYLVLSAKQMDEIGFSAVAKDEGLEPNEQGTVPLKDFPPEKIVAQAMIPRTLVEVEKEGWEFVAVTSSTAMNTVQGQSRSERIYIFRRPQ